MEKGFYYQFSIYIYSHIYFHSQVWADWKISIKRKLLQIKNDQPVALNPAEKSIAELCGFYNKAEIIRKSTRYPREQDDKSNVKINLRNFLSGASSSQIKTEIVNVAAKQKSSTRPDQPKKTIKANANKGKLKGKRSADLDADLPDGKRKRSRYTNSLEDNCGASNSLMTRVADSLDAMRLTMEEQKNAMLQHFKRIEEIELKKLEALKTAKK